ncbi:MAG: hypothetical protein K5894_15000 [Lachnospiraceae bacterium]|nr:hypothetical protein [Lachnospiraceae bacterium]
MNKNKRIAFLNSITTFGKQFAAGHQLISSRDHTDPHTALQKAVENCEDFMAEIKDEEDPISREKQEKILNLINEVKKRAEEYIKYTKENDHYALEADPLNKVRKASGDRRIRLEAVDKIRKTSVEFIRDNPIRVRKAGQVQKGSRISADTLSNRIHNNANNQDQNVQEEDPKLKELRTASVDSFKSFKESQAEYISELNSEGWTENRLKEQMKIFKDLHRDDLLEFEDDNEFIKNYEENRINLRKAIDAYVEMEKLRSTKNPLFSRVLNSVDIKEKTFIKNSIKLKELKLLEVYMDSKVKMLKSRVNVMMTENRRKALNKMTKEELEKEAERVAEIERNRSLKEGNGKPATTPEANYIRNMAALKSLSEFGITQRVDDDELKKEGSLFEITKETENTKSSFKLFSGSISVAKKFNPESGIDSGRYASLIQSGDDEDENYYNWSAYETGVELLAAQGAVAKTSFKYKSEDGKKKFSAKVNVGHVKATANAGFFFAGCDDILNTQIHATVEAEASLVKGSVKGEYKTGKNTSVYGNAEGQLLSASARARIGAGLISYTNADGEDVDTLGVVAEARALTTVARGSVSGGFSIFGIKIGVSMEGYAAGVGVEAGATIVGTQAKFSIGAALGFGAGLGISIDWSEARERFRNWRKRCRERKAIRNQEELKKQELKDAELKAKEVKEAKVKADGKVKSKSGKTPSQLFAEELSAKLASSIKNNHVKPLIDKADKEKVKTTVSKNKLKNKLPKTTENLKNKADKNNNLSKNNNTNKRIKRHSGHKNTGLDLSNQNIMV